MANKHKRKILKLRYVVFLFILFYIGTTFINQQSVIKKLEMEKIKKEKEIERLKTEVNETREKIDNVEDLDYIEKLAREELKMIKEGEILIIDSSKKKNTFNDEKVPSN